MALQDVSEVQKHLKRAEEAAVPVKDKELTKRITEVSEYIEKRIDPKKQE